MPKLKNLLIIHTTADQTDAESSAHFSLEINRPGPDLRIDVPNNPGQRQKGKLDLYPIAVSHHNIDTDTPGFSIIMSIKSGAGWLPGAIFVLGQTQENELILLGNYPYWTEWFDKGADAVGEASHEITGEQP